MDAGWYQGSVKVVGRDSQRSADLYKQATSDRLPAAIKALEDSLYMLQECTPYLPTKDWKVVKLEEHERHVNQAGYFRQGTVESLHLAVGATV